MPARGARHEPTHEQRLYKSSPRAPRPSTGPARTAVSGHQRWPAALRALRSERHAAAQLPPGARASRLLRSTGLV